MRQRNVHGYPLMVPSIGQTVHPGGVVEHDTLIPGFEEVSDEPDSSSDEPDDSPLADEHEADEGEPRVTGEREPEGIAEAPSPSLLPGPNLLPGS